MAKGYMIFVEGGETPKVVHPTYDSAFWQMKQLAEKFPGKEVMLFGLQKRTVNKDGIHTPLPCHIPDDFKNPERSKFDRLVFKNNLKTTKAA